MPDLTTAAADFTDVRPRTSYLDPAQGLNIMQRYGASQVGRGFAEDALKSANEIDKASNYDPQNRRNDLESHEWQRTIKDRADEEYEQKKGFDKDRAQFLIDFARLDPEDPLYDEKAATFMADPRVQEDTAFKAMWNTRESQRGDLRRQQSQRETTHSTMAEEFALNYGGRPDDYKAPDGTFDVEKGYAAKSAHAQALANQERNDADFKNDPALRDANTLGALEPIRAVRTGTVMDAASKQGASLLVSQDKDPQTGLSTLDVLMAAAPGLTEDAFVASMFKLSDEDALPAGFSSMNSTERALLLMNRSSRVSKVDPELKKAAAGLYKAALKEARVRAQATPTSDAPTQSPGEPSTPGTKPLTPEEQWLEEQRKRRNSQTPSQ